MHFICTWQSRSTSLTSSLMMTDNPLQASLEVWKLLSNEVPANSYFRDTPHCHCFFLLNSPTTVQRGRILCHSQSLLNLYICFFLSSWILLLPQFSLTDWSNIFLKYPKRSFHSSFHNTSGRRQTGQLYSPVRRRHFLSDWVIWQDNYKFLNAGNQFVYTPLPYFILSIKSLLSKTYQG